MGENLVMNFSESIDTNLGYIAIIISIGAPSAQDVGGFSSHSGYDLGELNYLLECYYFEINFIIASTYPIPLLCRYYNKIESS